MTRRRHATTVVLPAAVWLAPFTGEPTAEYAAMSLTAVTKLQRG